MNKVIDNSFLRDLNTLYKLIIRFIRCLKANCDEEIRAGGGTGSFTSILDAKSQRH